MTWTAAIALDRLRRDGKAVARIGDRQIALFLAGDSVLACNNRCPHEGYPLREGTLDGACVLTCNWHNWKFDLRTGVNLYGGDRLRVYPTRLVDDEVWVDVTEPPPAEREALAMANLRAAFDDHEYDRIARELARLAKAGGDPVAAVAAAIDWSHERLEYGMTHAYAATAGWLALHDASEDAETRLICLLEAIGHMAWDALREPVHPFGTGTADWDEAGFLAAIEAQDEKRAVAYLRGALAAGLHFGDVEQALTAAALSHYADFGHSLIYVMHCGRLVRRLGPAVEAPLLLALVRSLAYASREDLIPEFRAYAVAREAWPRQRADGGPAPPVESFLGRSVEATLSAAVQAASGAAPEALYQALLGANARNLLQYDLRWQVQTDGTIAQNIGWLDFTHGITFANAVRRQCTMFPALWPEGLLQMACFAGRNSAFTLAEDQLPAWRVEDRADFAARCRDRLLDHGEQLYILPAHLLKTYLAASEEIAVRLPDDIEETVLAALNRFLSGPLKRKHVRRTAHQAMRFVALED